MTKLWRINTRRKLIRQRKACAVVSGKVLAKVQAQSKPRSATPAGT